MFKVILSNGWDDLDLVFKVRNTDIARKWFSELQKEYEIFEDDRFSDWGDRAVINQLNYHIDVINDYDPIIDQKVDSATDQQQLNYLHKFFEDLRGEVTDGTDWFNSAPENVKHSVERFNVLIHELESTLRTKGKQPTVVVTFKLRPRFELTDKDCEHFTYLWKSGTVYINYCQVGKTVLDAYKDNDELTGAVRPQTHYSADFMIKFGPSTNWLWYIIRSALIKFWLSNKSYRFENLNLGMIPVADLCTPVDKATLLKFNKVKKVSCIQ